MKSYSFYYQDSGSGNIPPPPPPPPSFSPQPPVPPPSSSPNTGGGASSNAIFALVLGILSYLLCGLFAAIPAWVLGKKELNEINAGRSPEAGKTLATIGMWLGIINVILSVIAIISIAFLFMLGILSSSDFNV
ncbi:MAG: DUF4190 domain-containing protein [Ignavibacteria bacterium]|nr:DUF4190 domain-containing protein [Ignavibacteria bacterium]